MAFTDSLYPYYGVLHLRSRYGQRWAELVEGLRGLEPSDPHVMAFTMTVRRLRRAHALPASMCHDPFCAVCAAEVLDHFSGTEDELIRFYRQNLDEIRLTVKQMRVRRIERPAAVPAYVSAVA